MKVNEYVPGSPLDDEGEILDLGDDLKLSQAIYVRPHLQMFRTLEPRAPVPRSTKLLKRPWTVRKKKKRGWYDKRIGKRRGVRSYCVKKKREFIDEMVFEGPIAG